MTDVLFTSSFQRDPYPAYRWLRDHEPCHVMPGHSGYALSRYADVAAALRHPELFSSAGRRGAGGPSLLFMDPPDHGKLRRNIAAWFTPGRIAAGEPRIRSLARRMLSHLLARGGGDFVSAYALPLPVALVMDLLGVPDPDREHVARLISGSLLLTEDGSRYGAELRHYWLRLAGGGRPSPARGGLVQELAAPSGSQDRLSTERIAGLCSLVSHAGTESVAALLSNSLVLLNRYRDQWPPRPARDLAPAMTAETAAAVAEEALRYWAPTQFQERTTTAETTIHGVTLPPGSRVLMLTGSAGRDGRVYQAPDTFDPGRFGQGKKAPAALGFGQGPHFCLGAALGRLQARITLEELAPCLPAMKLDEDKTVRSDVSNGYGYLSVPVTFDQKSLPAG